MASVTFPYALVDIMANDYSVSRNESIQRTELEDNYVRQVKSQSASRELHSFSFVVKLSNQKQFWSWLTTNGSDYFNFSPFMDNHDLDLDDANVDEVQFDARIVGGSDSVEMRLHANERYEGEPFFTGEMTVEFIRGAP